MEENRNFSWSNLFIKVIIVVLFVLFTMWLLSLSNKGLSNSLDVLTDNIFSENIEKMKEVGKEYFTNERLPKKVGDIKTLTLEEMYEKKLILELKDKFGNACDADDSYISIEKLENEYQMKVSLECGEQEDYIIVIMGCYNYCDTDICEKEETVEKEIEYEYKKTTGGKWTDYGKWSQWSKVAVTKNNYRQVETKIEKEDYSYDKTIVEKVYASFEATCPDGYKKTADGTKCYKEVTTTDTKNPTCPTVPGYTLTNSDGFNCNYSKTTTSTSSLVCPTVSGYTFNGINGTTCNYSKTTTSTKDPVCPTVSEYTYTGRNGFTCNYSKTSTNYELEYVTTKKGSYVPANTDKYAYKEYGAAEYVYDCNNSCAFRWIHTYKVYKKVYSTTTETTTKTASCPAGYNKSGSTCVKNINDSITKTASCPAGYKNINGICTKDIIVSTMKNAICPKGYSKSGNTCTKTVTNNEYKDLVKTCPVDYTKTEDGTKCYKDVSSTVKVTGTKEVTYYRYRVREYVGGTTDYKWSTSKEDKKLLDAGYKLTGRTR